MPESRPAELDADVARVLAALAALDAPPLSAGTPERARANYDAAPKPAGDELAEVVDRVVEAVGRSIPVRCYAAEPGRNRGVIAFFHGGGWVLSSIEGHDSLARRIAARTGALVVSVDYRLSPEHPYPAPHEDCWVVTRWLSENADEWGGDPSRLAVCGDSAGGNLAAGIALRARDEGVSLVAQALIYPCIDDRQTRPSMTENAEGYFLTAADMVWFWDHFVPTEHRSDPRAVPARAEDLSGMAPALVQVAHFDPLRDEGIEYAERLRDAGVEVELTSYPGVVHGFVSRWEQMARAEQAHAELGDFLRRRLGS